MTPGRERHRAAGTSHGRHGRLRLTLVTVLIGGTCALLLATVPRSSAASDGRDETANAELVATSLVSGLVDRSPAHLPVRCIPASSRQTYGVRPLAVAAFDDARLGAVTSQGEVSAGGVVEVFRTADGARQRRAELADQIRAAKAMGFDEGGRPLDEHLVVEGRVVLRLGGRLDHPQARAYAELLRDLLGSPANAVHPADLEAAQCST